MSTPMDIHADSREIELLEGNNPQVWQTDKEANCLSQILENEYLNQIFAKLPRVENQLENPWIEEYDFLQVEKSILQSCGIHFQKNHEFVFVVGGIAISRRYRNMLINYSYENKNPTKTNIRMYGWIRRDQLSKLLDLISKKDPVSIKREELMEILSETGYVRTTPKHLYCGKKYTMVPNAISGREEKVYKLLDLLSNKDSKSIKREDVLRIISESRFNPASLESNPSIL